MSEYASTRDSLAVVARALKATREATEALEVLLSTMSQRDERLDRFRENSAARVIAEALLAYPDQWLTKDALAQTAQVSPTSVPHVVQTLIKSGVPVERRIKDRHASYRVRSTNP